MKECVKCKIKKELNEFTIRKNSKDGHRNDCKKCRNIYNKENNKKYRVNNKELIKENKRKYREDNKELIKEKSRKYYENNKEAINECKKKYTSEKYKNNKLFRLSVLTRNIITKSLKAKSYKKKSRTHEILGCSFEELLKHLNDNPYNFIHEDGFFDVDHIIPISSATTEEELIKLCHYTNLQLLPSDYNRHVKSDNKFDKDCLEKWLITN